MVQVGCWISPLPHGWTSGFIPGHLEYSLPTSYNRVNTQDMLKIILNIIKNSIVEVIQGVPGILEILEL